MVFVAIQSVAFPDRYVRLDGHGVTSSTLSGGGEVTTSTFVGTYETFALIENDDKTVFFKSTAFDNVFLRLDGAGVDQGQILAEGGGYVNAQYTANILEKFRIREKYSGIVGIESVIFVGRYLRLDGPANKVNVQGVFGTDEEFRIIFVGE